jgi:hypothetical protein
MLLWNDMVCHVFKSARKLLFLIFCVLWFSTNMMSGRLCTRVRKEKVICCGLGSTGCLVCVATAPLSVYHPIAAMVAFCSISNTIRQEVIAQYNVEEEQCCCCGDTLNSYINYCHFGCNYPCSLFQVLVALDEWEHEQQAVVSVAVPVPSVVANPVVARGVVLK